MAGEKARRQGPAVPADLGPSPKALGQVVRAHRLRLGLTIEALAERSQLHPTYLSDIELATGRGRNPSIGKLKDLSAAFGIPLSALIGEAEAATISTGSHERRHGGPSTDT